MTTIAALLNRDGRPADPAVVRALWVPAAGRGPDGEDVWREGTAALGHQHGWVTPEEVGERQPLVDPAGRHAITCDGRLDNRAELAAALGIPPAEVGTLSDAALVLRAYLRWGTACPGHLLGEFAFAVWDGVERRLFLARDALGGRGLAWWWGPRGFVAATDVDQVMAHPDVSPRINEGKVARYLIGDWVDQAESFCQPIRHLPAAHCMTVSAERIHVWRYWDIDPERRVRYRSDGEYAEHFLDLLTAAVRCRLRAVGPVGLALSGGSDSTALAAVATAIWPAVDPPPERLRTFSYVFDELPSCDERAFIQPVVEHLGLEATYIACDDRWPLRDLAGWPVERDFVLADGYIWLPIAVMRAARAAGCRLLMTGHNGDNLFWDDAFWLLDVLREGAWGTAARTLARRSVREWRGSGTIEVVRALLPDRVRRTWRRLRPRPRPAWVAMVEPELAARANLEGDSMVARSAPRFRSVSQRHHYVTLLGDGLLQSRPVVHRLYARHGLELIEPFYDRRLVEFAMAVPAHQWGRPGRGKWLLRNAMAGRLPRPVAERQSVTSFTALWERGLCQRERGTVEGLLREPEVVRRGFVRPAWLAAQRAAGCQTADEGYLLWLCASLELWLRRWW